MTTAAAASEPHALDPRRALCVALEAIAELRALSRAAAEADGDDRFVLVLLLARLAEQADERGGQLLEALDGLRPPPASWTGSLRVPSRRQPWGE